MIIIVDRGTRGRQLSSSIGGLLLFYKMTLVAAFPARKEESPMKLNAVYDACVITKVQSPSSRWVVPVIKRYVSV